MGDFSRSPLKTLEENQKEGYVGLHVEQGVPVLDRDLNLLNDLITATVRSLIQRYIGDGNAHEDDGFAIEAIPAANDFRICPGHCLVGGHEVILGEETTYMKQVGLPGPFPSERPARPDIQKLETPNLQRDDLIYLDVWLLEVDGTKDDALRNRDDVGMQTSVREQLNWMVRVAPGVAKDKRVEFLEQLKNNKNNAGHTYYALAELERPRGNPKIETQMITDLRQRRLTATDMERRLSEMESLLRFPKFVTGEQFSDFSAFPGQTITLFGKNFDVGDVKVEFISSDEAVKVDAEGTPTSTEIQVKVPTGINGDVKIKVITGGGEVLSTSTFAVVLRKPAFAEAQQFSDLSAFPGKKITLFGENFDVGDVKVEFIPVGSEEGVRVDPVGTPTSTEIQVKVPTGINGDVKIKVITGGGEDTSDKTFTIL